MKKLFLLVSILTAFVGTQATFAQGKYISRNAHVSFFSATPMEDIEAHNRKTASILDSKTGALTFKMNIKAFEFKKALMQEHFNENYMESSKFPNATFKGALTDLSSVNFGKDGTYKVKTKGTMEIHGVKKEIEVPGTLTIGGGAITIKSDFTVACADYNIQIPGVVREKIAKEINVKVEAKLNPMK